MPTFARTYSHFIFQLVKHTTKLLRLLRVTVQLFNTGITTAAVLRRRPMSVDSCFFHH